jgi:4-diphosphocytidyl-2-C-methyl-D-erythritol kinase
VLGQAKLNLFLHILARERSGYHQIETLLVRVDLADTVVIRTAVRGRSLDVAGVEVPAGGLGPVERNLAWRAALAYVEVTGWPEHFAIELTKRIPVGGGLGGGSADAGAVLRGLDALNPASPLGQVQLLAVAASLGADVPFLTSASATALAWGRGERMLAVQPPLSPRAVWLLVPPFGVATVEAYGWVAASRGDGGRVSSSRVLSAGDLAHWPAVAVLAHNDFEADVARRHPLIGALVDALRRQGAIIAQVSGSGSTVFGVFAREGQGPAADMVSAGVRLVRTRTSAHVEEVEVSE